MSRLSELSPEEQEVLQWNFSDLMSILHPVIDDVIDQAFSIQLIGDDDRISLLDTIDPYEKTCKFLDIIPKRGSNALKLLLSIIDQVNKNVSDDIRGQLEEKEMPSRQAPNSNNGSSQQAASINNPAAASNNNTSQQVASTNNTGGGDTVDAKENLEYDAFLSHCWLNKPHVTTVKEFLQQQGIKCWIDDKQLHGGMELLPELAKAIRKSKVFVAFMSKKYIESENCYKEISYARDKGIKIIGVIIEKIDPKKDLVSSTGRDFLIYISNDLYIKIIVKYPPDDEMQNKLAELATAVKKYCQ